MKQYIYVQATVPTIVNGIADFKKLVSEQTTVRPEVYLPIVSYLERYARQILPQKDDKKDKDNQSKEIPIKTTVVCNNAKILEDYKKVENFLYNQTKIKPEVYLHIIDKIEEFIDILREQERREYKKILQQDNQEQEKETEEKQTNETSETQRATKNKDMNLSNLKKFM